VRRNLNTGEAARFGSKRKHKATSYQRVSAMATSTADCLWSLQIALVTVHEQGSHPAATVYLFGRIPYDST
jgi:hypothetical protein